MAESRIALQGFIGPSYQALSDRFNNQRTVNMYLETDQTTGSAKDSGQAVLLGTPGLVSAVDFFANYPIRQLYVPSGKLDGPQIECMYAFTGNQVWITYNGTDWVQCQGQLDTVLGFISVSDNGTDLVAVDGFAGYKIPIGQGTITKIDSLNFYPADTIDFQDGYFICNRKGTAQFFTSDLNSATWSESTLATKSSTADAVVGIVSNNKLLYVFGSQSIEIWTHTGANIVQPFEQISSQYISIGCFSAATIVQLAGTVLWLGKTVNGSGIVYVMEGQSAKEVSTKPVTLALQSYEKLSQAVAYGYQEEGHYFYVLNVPGVDTTWVYDLTENQWHERQSYIPVPQPEPVFPTVKHYATIRYVQNVGQIDQYNNRINFNYPTKAGNLIFMVALSSRPDDNKPTGQMPPEWKEVDLSTTDHWIVIYYKFSNGESYFPTLRNVEFNVGVVELYGIDDTSGDPVFDANNSDDTFNVFTFTPGYSYPAVPLVYGRSEPGNLGSAVTIVFGSGTLFLGVSTPSGSPIIIPQIPY